MLRLITKKEKDRLKEIESNTKTLLISIQDTSHANDSKIKKAIAIKKLRNLIFNKG